MLSQCANSQCSKPFLKLREGKLFLLESEAEARSAAFVRIRQRNVEHYWLCDECAGRWTLISGRDQGVALVPLRRAVESVGAVAVVRGGVA